MSSKKTAVLVTAGVVAATGVLAVVAVPAAADWFGKRHEQASSYATGAEAKSERASVPRWLPDDAKSVRYVMRTTGGDRLLKATLPSTELPAECRPATTDGAKKPDLSASWFPLDAQGQATARCGAYYAYMTDTTLYAWQDDKDWQDANRSGTAGQ
ncbi:hypothetical protein ACFP1Z_09980 [Streptomyces gamaensis]|uniref:Lipoprotein n=1 Tax=Streptomyces gamaensis TaxID=1763542 RepID=A0ABW0YYJ8_9ACTN